MSDQQRYPLKLCLIKDEKDNFYVERKSKLIFCFRDDEDNYQISTYLDSKVQLSSPLLRKELIKELWSESDMPLLFKEGYFQIISTSCVLLC